jgi:flagellar biosynthesis/type III secretory pathway protein FliH
VAFHLIHADGQALLGSDSPLLRAEDRQPLEDAIALLDAVTAMHREREATLAAERAAAATAGHAAGVAAGQAAYADAIAALAARVDADSSARMEAVARLALAALRQMLGALPDDERMAAIARRAVETLGTRGPVLVDVSAAMAGPVARAFAERPLAVEVLVRGVAALADDQCRLSGPDGRIIADVPVQLQAFAARWEMADAL